jgi:hypothetical protein
VQALHLKSLDVESLDVEFLNVEFFGQTVTALSARCLASIRANYL